MPKGRGSNEARRNHRLRDRGVGGSQAGLVWPKALANQAEFRARRGDPGAPSVPFWHRLAAKIRRGVWEIHTKVAPRSAGRKLEREYEARKNQVMMVTNTHAGMRGPRAAGGPAIRRQRRSARRR